MILHIEHRGFPKILGMALRALTLLGTGFKLALVGVRFWTLLAVDLDVKTRQRIAGLGVIELLCCLPVRVIMALQAIVSELAFVDIFMARHAVLRQSEKGLRKFLHLDERAFIGNHVRRHVALLASKARMLSFQDVTRQPMIKLFL